MYVIAVYLNLMSCLCFLYSVLDVCLSYIIQTIFYYKEKQILLMNERNFGQIKFLI